MFRICEKLNTATFVRYLDELRREYGKILVLADGAAPHRPNTMMDYIARHHATVVLRRFPVGASHITPSRRRGADQNWTPRCANITTRLRI